MNEALVMSTSKARRVLTQLQDISYVSRRRLTDDADFDPEAVRCPSLHLSWLSVISYSHVCLNQKHQSSYLLQVDDEGLPLVYNEARITEFWRNR